MSERPVRIRSTLAWQRGLVAIELALVIFPLIAMMLAAIEFGRAVYVYNQIVKATRDGARHLSGYDPSDSSRYPVGVAVNRVLYGTNGAQGGPNVPGLTASMVRVCDRLNSNGCTPGTFGVVDTAYGPMGLVRVEVVGYVYVPFVPGLSRMVATGFGAIGSSMRQVL